ncbi:hypothetical protein [Parasitella parasitica]|uniref:Uncharacterized protein n=1 Tax=Parasitella parasitica TaxID=35722 RepID=A0A0B7NVU4_9FUNG|nr:hypothetical protein [Parasitella parasitica]
MSFGFEECTDAHYSVLYVKGEAVFSKVFTDVDIKIVDNNCIQLPKPANNQDNVATAIVRVYPAHSDFTSEIYDNDVKYRSIGYKLIEVK